MVPASAFSGVNEMCKRIDADASPHDMQLAISDAMGALVSNMRNAAYARRDELDFVCAVINETRVIERIGRKMLQALEREQNYY